MAGVKLLERANRPVEGYTHIGVIPKPDNPKAKLLVRYSLPEKKPFILGLYHSSTQRGDISALVGKNYRPDRWVDGKKNLHFFEPLGPEALRTIQALIKK